MSAKLLDVHGQPMPAGRNGRAHLDTAHRAASTTAAEFQTWQVSGGSADTDLLGELPTMRERGRDLVRNHGITTGAINTLVDNVVGTGLQCQPRPDAEALGWSRETADAWAEEVSRAWATFAEAPEFDAARHATFHDMTTEVFCNQLVNGEALVLPLWRPSRAGTRWATCFQGIEPDRLSTPVGRETDRRMRDGVEVNRYGEPVAYHIRTAHPGAWLEGGWEAPRWERVRARMSWGRRRALHIFRRERWGQHRGKPIMAPIMSALRMYDKYADAELRAAVVNAMVAAFVESPMDGETMAGMWGSATEYMQDRAEWDVTLEGGTIQQLFPGDKVSSFAPNRPNAEFDKFSENMLRHVGVGLNLPYELLMRDFSKTNYSSARAALLEAWRHFRSRRAWLATQWCQPVYELWLEEAVGRGVIRAPGFYEAREAYSRARWIGPGRGWIDPKKEAEAAEIRMRAGVTTLEEECAEQGRDWRDVLEQRRLEETVRQDKGLAPAGDPGASENDQPTDEQEGTA